MKAPDGTTTCQNTPPPSWEISRFYGTRYDKIIQFSENEYADDIYLESDEHLCLKFEDSEYPHYVGNWVDSVWFANSGSKLYLAQRDTEWGLLAVQEYTNETAEYEFDMTYEDMLVAMRYNALTISRNKDMQEFHIYAVTDYTTGNEIDESGHGPVSHVSIFFPVGAEPIGVWKALYLLYAYAMGDRSKERTWANYMRILREKIAEYCMDHMSEKLNQVSMDAGPGPFEMTGNFCICKRDYPFELEYITNCTFDLNIPEDDYPHYIGTWAESFCYEGSGVDLYVIRRNQDWGVLAVCEFDKDTAEAVFMTTYENMLEKLAIRAQTISDMDELATFDVFYAEEVDVGLLSDNNEAPVSHISVFFPYGTEPLAAWKAIYKLGNHAFDDDEETSTWELFCTDLVRIWPSYCTRHGIPAPSGEEAITEGGTTQFG